MPEAQDVREDLVGQRGAARGAPAAGSRLAGVRDRCGTEAANEVRRRRRAAGEAQVAEGEELDDGLARVAPPGSGVRHGREQVDCVLIKSRKSLRIVERSIPFVIAKTERSAVSEQNAQWLNIWGSSCPH